VAPAFEVRSALASAVAGRSGAAARSSVAAFVVIASAKRAVCANHTRAALTRERWTRAITLRQQPCLEALYAAAQRVDVGKSALSQFLRGGETSTTARTD
jgi:hypothetical protein